MTNPLKHSENNPNWLKSINFRIKSPQGSVYIQIIEKDTGKIERIFITVGKAGSGINAMCAGLSELMAVMVKNGISITDIIVALSGITSDKSLRSNGMEITSPVDAVVLALLQYRSSIPNELKNHRKSHLRSM